MSKTHGAIYAWSVSAFQVSNWDFFYNEKCHFSVDSLLGESHTSGAKILTPYTPLSTAESPANMSMHRLSRGDCVYTWNTGSVVLVQTGFDHIMSLFIYTYVYGCCTESLGNSLVFSTHAAKVHRVKVLIVDHLTCSPAGFGQHDMTIIDVASCVTDSNIHSLLI